MFDFAGRLRDLFEQEFRHWKLTISAGLAVAKWRRPIKLAAAEADRLLELAKSKRLEGEEQEKDQIAASGQVWNWRDHAAVVAARLAAYTIATGRGAVRRPGTRSPTNSATLAG